MGGNALKNCFTRRYNKDEYNILKEEVKEHLLNSENIFRAEIPYSYRNKETFGDLDIVIDFKDKFDLRTFIKDKFNSKEIVSNGDCISFEYKEFQIDLIKAKDDFNTTLEYLNWNDLGNLIGRVAHKFGLKYGHKGLLYIIKNDAGYNPREIKVSANTREILDFLGFDFDKYTFGFDSVKEIYDFVISSKYFNPEIFSFEEMNHTNRVRNKKRVTYQGFIDYLENEKLFDNKDNYFKYNSDKTFYLPRLNYYFPEIQIFKFIEKYNSDITVLNSVKEKFNGKVVENITNLTGQQLGEFIAYFKNSYLNSLNIISNDDFNKWVITNQNDLIDKTIKDAFTVYKNAPKSIS